MAISHGNSIKKLTIYPLAKYVMDLINPLWVSRDEENDYYDDLVKLALTIKQSLNLKDPSEDGMILNFMKNMYPSTVQIRELDDYLNEVSKSSCTEDTSITT